MSMQFGRWNFEEAPLAPEHAEKISQTLAPYGPDSDESYSHGGLTILYRAFNTTPESWREKQPYVLSSGTVITYDGRLDNRPDLLGELTGGLSHNATDLAIVACTYEKWGNQCFAKLIGDWAVSVVNRHDRSLILAKDFVGSRHLYYKLDQNQVTWSTILDPLILFAGKAFRICEEYVAGWLSQVPAAHLTPYNGIHSVPPSSFVMIRPAKQGLIQKVTKYWDFDPSRRIRYRTDAEYEEHFRTAFSQAVQRKLRSDRPILAELSGGMDSSSIVCVADTLIKGGNTKCPRLDTISWYDDANPHYNERPFFTKVEELRGRTGCHIDLSFLKDDCRKILLESDLDGDSIFALPPVYWGPRRFCEEYAAHMSSQGHRVALSGFGGEQPTGGGAIPSPTIELQNLLARARFLILLRQLKAWAARMKERRLLLLWRAVCGFFPASFAGNPKGPQLPIWLNPGFVRRNHAALRRYPDRTKLFGALPSFQNHLKVLECERRLVANFAPNPKLLRELRFPFLDRDFREFAYAIPWNQTIRVGQRRSLMRRALVGIVPSELLNRKQLSASLSDERSQDLSTEWPGLAEPDSVLSGELGFVDPNGFREALQQAKRDREVPPDFAIRTLTLEVWLRHSMLRGSLAIPTYTRNTSSFSSLAPEGLARANSSASQQMASNSINERR
jgi:asparagine synthase (glutamine-hydrolysing)